MKLLISLLSAALIFSAHNGYAKTPSKPTTTRPGSSSLGATTMNSWSSEEDYEIQSGMSGGQYQTYKSASDTITRMDLQLSVAKLIKNNIQAGAEVHFNSTSGGGTSSYFEIVGFGVYNLTSLIKDTYYAKGGVGLFNTINDRRENESKFGFFVGGGKRIPLWNQITYSPEVRLFKKGSEDFTLSLYFLNVSLFF